MAYVYMQYVTIVVLAINPDRFRILRSYSLTQMPIHMQYLASPEIWVLIMLKVVIHINLSSMHSHQLLVSDSNPTPSTEMYIKLLTMKFMGVVQIAIHFTL